MTTRQILGVNESRANHETVEGETLILDPTTGVLTLLAGSGPLIWERLIVGADRGALLREIADVYGDAAATDAAAHLDELIASDLVIAIDGRTSAATEPTPWPAAYIRPTIERFEDIADIMTMDPIHEVDARLGWPHASTDPPPRSG